MLLTPYAPPTVEVEPFDIPVPGTGPGVEMDESFVARAAAAFCRFPSAIGTALAVLAAGEEPSGAVLCRGLPVGGVPPTPPSPTSVTDKDHQSEMLLLAVARHLGEPVGYAPEHGGRIVQNIVPVQSAASRQVSTSSSVPLEFHTETAFHPHKPHYLLLLCLRGDPAAATTLCSLSAALALLHNDTIAVLRGPRFRTRPDASFLLDPTTAGSFGAPCAILTGSPERSTFTFDADLMIGTDPEAQAALEALRHAVHAAHVAVVLQAGDLLVIDNHAAVHGRSPFVPRYDGTDRWLQRTFVVDDLAPSAPNRAGRVITTTFA
jgi:L-asparagine oxygenase